MIAVALGLWLGAAGSPDLEELGRRYDISWTCDPATGRHTIEADCLKIVAAPGFGVAIVNGAPVKLSAPATLIGGRLILPPELAERIEREAAVKGPPSMLTMRPKPATPAPRPPKSMPACKIVIDPGHGGLHTGYVGRGGLMEKDVNLDVSLELAKILEDMGATVVLTRTTDRHFHSQVDDDLDERIRIVNSIRPDLFLSIHGNGVSNPEPRGFEVWVPKNARGPRDRDSREIAQFIRGELGGVWGREDRGTKDERNLRVLNGTSCPAALVELEFVSNPWVERQLARRETRVKLAEALGESVWKWILRRR
jgi:N-acetylmuramoyl-L-alanine amidase